MIRKGNSIYYLAVKYVIATAVCCALAMPAAHAQLADMAATMAASAPLAGNAAPAPASATPPAPAASPAIPAPVIAAPSAAPGEAPPAVAEVPAVPRRAAPVKIRSLFFTLEEMVNIRMAISTYTNYTRGQGGSDFDEEDFLSKLGGIKTETAVQSRYYSYPQFFLESLVYDSPKNWFIWVNRQKITQDTPQEGADIYVVGIDGDKVVLQWKPGLSMEKVEDVLARMPNNEIDVDRVNGIVEFTLRPNQTFSSYVMRVLEGKVLPVTIDSGNGAPVTSVLNENADRSGDSKSLSSESPDDKKEGLGGLINAYEKMGAGSPPPTTATPQQGEAP